MKRIFSLICLFVFMFLGLIITVKADGAIAIDKIVDKYSENINDDVALNTYTYDVVYDNEEKKINVIASQDNDAESVTILEYNYVSDNENCFIELSSITDGYNSEYIAYWMIMTMLQLTEFPEEYYGYLTDEFLLSLNYEEHGLEIKVNEDNNISYLKIVPAITLSMNLKNEIDEQNNSSEDTGDQNTNNLLNIDKVTEAYMEYLTTSEYDYNVSNVILDKEKNELSVYLKDSTNPDYIFNYDASSNSLTYSQEDAYSDMNYTLYVGALEATIVELYGYEYDDWADAKNDLDTTTLTLEENGYYWNVDDEMNFTFKISLGENFKNMLIDTLGNPAGGLENPDTSDFSLGNIILIGGCLLLITGYGLIKLKKIK